jgi:hypothetical protein
LLEEAAAALLYLVMLLAKARVILQFEKFWCHSSLTIILSGAQYLSIAVLESIYSPNSLKKYYIEARA